MSKFKQAYEINENFALSVLGIFKRLWYCWWSLWGVIEIVHITTYILFFYPECQHQASKIYGFGIQKKN